jgi:cellulose synthase/poly-beta-1,6-N-acetylglucosamine synthase-like glycosyltransferase
MFPMFDLARYETAMLVLFIASQALYSLTFLFDFYLFSLPVNYVRPSDARDVPERDYPRIVLFYPVLHESEATMRTTMLSLTRVQYPAGKARVIAIPNADDVATVAALRRLQREFSFLELLEVPPTSDPTWETVWQAWEANPKAYWWHAGRRMRVRDLPPKKTRQLIYAFYRTVEEDQGGDFLVNYLDADSCPPPDHFLAAVAGMRQYDVLQAENIAGNLMASLPASLCAHDHMCWDGRKYAHLSANGRQPYWMLGKGLYFRASDLVELGGFHPWLSIEDPEVGMRFWKNGRRLGVIKAPVIEEAPLTLRRAIKQRKRWALGFFQSLAEPLDSLGFTPWEKVKAWLNFLPCLSLWVNAIGFPTGVWALWMLIKGAHVLPLWAAVLAAVNIGLCIFAFASSYSNVWTRSGLVLETKRERLAYLLRVNPLTIAAWWMIWLWPLAQGFWMYLRDHGLVWERTEKVNANQELIETNMGGAAHGQRAA